MADQAGAMYTVASCIPAKPHSRDITFTVMKVSALAKETAYACFASLLRETVSTARPALDERSPCTLDSSGSKLACNAKCVLQ
jgi:hypothetical protein